MIRCVLAAALLCACALPACATTLLIGDCLATMPGLGGQIRGATVIARQGAGSAEIVGKGRPGFADTIVSSGSNDIPWTTPARLVAARQAALRRNLEATRARLTGRVIWIVPNIPASAVIVREVAAAHGDPVATFVAGPDRVHPRSYVALARTVAPLMSEPPELGAAPAHPAGHRRH